jgi:hypothetical protein
MTPRQAKLFEGKDPSVLTNYRALASFFDDWNMHPKLRKDSIDWCYDKEDWGSSGVFVTAVPQQSALLLRIHSRTALDGPLVASSRKASANDYVNEVPVTSAIKFGDGPDELIQRAYETMSG